MTVLCTDGPFAGRVCDLTWLGSELLIPVRDIERRSGDVVYRLVVGPDGEVTAEYEGVRQYE